MNQPIDRPIQAGLFDGLEAPPEAAAGSPSPLWEAALTRRLRVLLYAEPLIDLHRGDTRRDPELRHYDALTLAMKVFDLIIDSAGLDKEVDRQRLETALAPLLTAMDAAAGVSPDSARHRAMVDRVLAGLRNDTDRRLPFDETYTDFDADEQAVRRKLEFRLVVDHFHPAGGTVLRLSNEAVNLFLNALELDIEDAQAAAEAVVLSQLARGKFAEAVQTARNARWQSLRFGEKVALILRETRRDISGVDWREDVPRLLDDALSHIEQRQVTERNIMSTALERLELLGEEEKSTQAVTEVRELIRDCQNRHAMLHGQLMQARNVFLDEQARQAFQPGRRVPLPNLISDVLEPVLRSGRKDAEKVTAKAFPPLVGPQPPPIFSLADLVTWMLRPRREPPRQEVPVEEPDLTRTGLDITRFEPAVQRRVREKFAAIDEPVSLHDLIDDISTDGAPDAALELAVLTALHAFGPDPEEQVPVAAARDPERSFSAHGFHGDNLILFPQTTETDDDEN